MACPSPQSGGAAQVVSDVFAAQRTYANTNFANLQSDIASYMGAISALDQLDLNTTIDWDAPDGLGQGFVKPSAPTDFSDGVVKPVEPQATQVFMPAVPTLDDIGTAPSSPALDLPNAPAAWDGDVPTDVPVIDDVTIPSMPAYTLPTAPGLSNIPIPDIPILVLPTFDGVLPDTNVDLPVLLGPEDEAAYSSTMLTALQGQILTVLQGDRGYLDTTFDAIWAREQQNEFATAQRAREAVTEGWAARNWDAPGGMEAEQLLRIEQDLTHQQSGRARDLAIEQNKVEVDRFMQHLAQGIALESRLIQYEEGRAQRSLQARNLFNQAGVQLYSAKVERINLKLQAYQTQAQVYGELIRGETLKLQKTESELKIASLHGEIDQRRIAVYVAQIEAVKQILGVYIAELQGVESQVRIGQVQVAAFGEQVKAVSLQLEAKNLEYTGFNSLIQGQLARTQIYSAETQAFASRAQAISAKNNSETNLYRAELEGQRLVLGQVEQNVRVFAALLDAEVRRFEGNANVHSQNVQAFVSKNQAEASRVQADGDQFRALVEKARAKESLALQQGQINANNVLRIAELELGGLDKIMTVHAQIGSAAMSALNASSAIQGADSSNWNFNHDCS